MSTFYDTVQVRRRSVLVAVLNNPADLERAAQGGWYRIPQRRAPRRIAADFLAFYQTGAFRGRPEALTVTYFAPTRRYRLLRRAELIPEEPDHPRAEEYYFCIEIGSLQRLARPVVASRLRRISFIHTTLERLQTAGDVTELFMVDEPFIRLWRVLREQRLRPLPNRIWQDRAVDITLRARGGYLGICCHGQPGMREGVYSPPPARWSLLFLAPDQVEADLDGCLRCIGAALIDLGGTDLGRHMTAEKLSNGG